MRALGGRRIAMISYMISYMIFLYDYYFMNWSILQNPGPSDTPGSVGGGGGEGPGGGGGGGGERGTPPKH